LGMSSIATQRGRPYAVPTPCRDLAGADVLRLIAPRSGLRLPAARMVTTKFCAADFIPNLETGLVAIIPPTFGAVAMILWRHKSDPAMERMYHLSPFTYRRLSHTGAYGRGNSNSMPKKFRSDCASPGCASGVFLRY